MAGPKVSFIIWRFYCVYWQAESKEHNNFRVQLYYPEETDLEFSRKVQVPFDIQHFIS